MNRTETQLPGLNLTLTAHRDNGPGYLMATLTAEETAKARARQPLQVALVIDRSGSMSGEKLDITKAAVAQFIRSLQPEDRVAVIAYDDHVDLIAGLSAPSEALARKVEALTDRGSTNLYGGWLMGAKIVGRGGRVILLSDGQANVGPFTDAHSLSQHAARSYEHYGVTTTTIGVGRDYDEGLMAGMARAGGGAHYFAHTAPSITDAFSQEHYSAGSVVLGRVTLRVNRTTLQLGHFWSGETKKRVLPLENLDHLEVTVRYSNQETNERLTFEVSPPTTYGYSEEVKLEFLLQRAAEAEAEMLQVQDPRSAKAMKEQLRLIVIKLLAHPSSDEPAVASIINRLKASIERLANLEANYEETEAMIHRKRSMQSSHNLMERAKSFSSFEEEQELLRTEAMRSAPAAAPVGPLSVDPVAFALASSGQWVAWQAIPVSLNGDELTVALEDPRRGFVIAEIEKATAKTVRAVFAGTSAQEIIELLGRA